MGKHNSNYFFSATTAVYSMLQPSSCVTSYYLLVADTVGVQ